MRRLTRVQRLNTEITNHLTKGMPTVKKQTGRRQKPLYRQAENAFEDFRRTGSTESLVRIHDLIKLLESRSRKDIYGTEQFLLELKERLVRLPFVQRIHRKWTRVSIWDLAISEEYAKELAKHVRIRGHKEFGGTARIVKKGKNWFIEPIAYNRQQFSRLAPAFFEQLRNPEAALMFHTHPVRFMSEESSQADRDFSDMLGIPVLIISLPRKTKKPQKPTLELYFREKSIPIPIK